METLNTSPNPHVHGDRCRFQFQHFFTDCQTARHSSAATRPKTAVSSPNTFIRDADFHGSPPYEVGSREIQVLNTGGGGVTTMEGTLFAGCIDRFQLQRLV